LAGRKTRSQEKKRQLKIQIAGQRKGSPELMMKKEEKKIRLP